MSKKIIVFLIALCLNIELASAFEASYYSDSFEGSNNANGTVFSQLHHSAAICYEDLSQFAYVNTTQTGMVVTLTDRPNCSRHTDRIDLSSSVFSRFAPLSQWLITDISATPLAIKTGKFIKRDILQEEFQDLFIKFSEPIANTYFRSEIVHIRWKVLNNEKYVMTYLENKSTWKKYSYSYPINSDHSFDILLSVPDEAGEYYFVIAAGTSFRTQKPLSIFVADSFVYPILSGSSIAQWDIKLSQSRLGDTPNIDLPEKTWWTLSLIQWKNTFSTQGQVLDIKNSLFSPGTANYIFTGYTLSTSSSLDRNPAPAFSQSGTFVIDKIRSSIEYGKATLRKSGKTIQFSFRISNGYRVKSTYYVTLPNGDTRPYTISPKYIWSDGYVKGGVLVKWFFPIPDPGTYRFELVQDTGIAYVNLPIYTQETLAIIDPNVLLKKWETYTGRILDSINSIRKPLGRGALTLDAELSVLATRKAQDMFLSKTSNGLWVSHTNSQWWDIRALAKLVGIERSLFGENVAWANTMTNKTLLELQDGLEESPGHRYNMVSPKFTKIWIWYYQNGGYSYLVHVLSN